MKIYFIRHAQVGSNLKNIAYNKKNEDLTKEGKKQAEKLAKKLIRLNIDKIFISKSKRAYQTILPLLKLQSISVKKDKRLDDCKYGIFSGLTLKEAKGKHPKIFKKRWEDKWNIPIPKGESFKDVAERLCSFFKNLEREAKKFQFENIVIVTHATNLKVFLIQYLKFNIKKADSVQFKNTSISIFEFKNNNIKTEVINDFSHLNNDTSQSKRIH